VGFHQGGNLKDFWKLEEHKLGETTFTHFPEDTGHENRMQGNDFVQSVMYTRGVTCFSCHDVHGTSNNADLIKPIALGVALSLARPVSAAAFANGQGGDSRGDGSAGDGGHSRGWPSRRS
jgi:hypothetical protein